MALTLNGTTGIQNVLGSAASPAESNTTSSNTGMYFPTSTTLGFSTAGTNAVTIDASQNVGIGQSTPTVKLDVNGATNFGGTSGVRCGVGTAFLGGQAEVYAQGAVPLGIGTASTQVLRFYTNSTLAATIDTSGRLLVGATSYTGVGLSLATPDAGGSTSFFAGSGTGNHWRFGANNTGPVGSISTSSSATTYATSSDYRLKHDVAPMVSALSKVAALKPVIYKWNADGSDGEGFIAHELAEVVPQCVIGEKDAVDSDGKPQYQGVDTSFLVATLTAAIQEQQALITQLTDRIAALEAK